MSLQIYNSNIIVECSRCKQLVEGIKTKNATGGFYEVSSGVWHKYSNKEETILCDSCMWHDPRYIEIYGIIY